MPNSGIPNLSVTDGFDFMKKMWGSVPLPDVMGSVTDLDELDKRISDLKAVEQWLNINLSMLRATIQGLEVQRGTIAAINSFSAHLGSIGVPGLSVPAANASEVPSAKTTGSTSIQQVKKVEKKAEEQASTIAPPTTKLSIKKASTAHNHPVVTPPHNT